MLWSILFVHPELEVSTYIWFRLLIWRVHDQMSVWKQSTLSKSAWPLWQHRCTAKRKMQAYCETFPQPACNEVGQNCNKSSSIFPVLHFTRRKFSDHQTVGSVRFSSKTRNITFQISVPKWRYTNAALVPASNKKLHIWLYFYESKILVVPVLVYSHLIHTSCMTHHSEVCSMNSFVSMLSP